MCIAPIQAGLYATDYTGSFVPLTPGSTVYSNMSMQTTIIVESVLIPCGLGGCGKIHFYYNNTKILEYVLPDNAWFYRGTGTAQDPKAGRVPRRAIQDPPAEFC